MRIGVLSDTHSNIELLRSAIQRMLEFGRIDLVIHLGDNYKDAEVIAENGISYIRVPGVYCEAYKDPSITNRRIEVFEGWRFLLSHTDSSHPLDLPDDLRPESLLRSHKVDVFLHGHTHKPRLEVKDGILFMNPGHLKQENEKGIKPSFGLIDVTENSINARIIDVLTGEEVASIRLDRRFSDGQP